MSSFKSDTHCKSAGSCPVQHTCAWPAGTLARLVAASEARSLPCSAASKARPLAALKAAISSGSKVHSCSKDYIDALNAQSGTYRHQGLGSNLHSFSCGGIMSGMHGDGFSIALRDQVTTAAAMPHSDCRLTASKASSLAVRICSHRARVSSRNTREAQTKHDTCVRTCYSHRACVNASRQRQGRPKSATCMRVHML